MVYQPARVIRLAQRTLLYADACAIASGTRSLSGAVVLVDLSQIQQATIAAFAKLVEVRQSLLSRGGDLRLIGLVGQAQAVHAIHRLQAVLPIDHTGHAHTPSGTASHTSSHTPPPVRPPSR